jgi:hypothetical protein
MGDAITLTAAQAEQLTAFLREKEHEGSVLLRRAKHLGALEAVLLHGRPNARSSPGPASRPWVPIALRVIRVGGEDCRRPPAG